MSQTAIIASDIYSDGEAVFKRRKGGRARKEQLTIKRTNQSPIVHPSLKHNSNTYMAKALI
jgi:hypothetical protein